MRAVVGEKQDGAVDRSKEVGCLVRRAGVEVDIADQVSGGSGASGLPEFHTVVAVRCRKEQPAIRDNQMLRIRALRAWTYVFDQNRSGGRTVGLPQFGAGG